MKDAETPRGITERLIAQADNQLKSQIEAAAAPLDSMLRNGCGYSLAMPTTADSAKKVDVLWYVALNAMKEQAFNLAYEQNRQNAIDNFMAQVNRLGSEIDELRSSVSERE